MPKTMPKMRPTRAVKEPSAISASPAKPNITAQEAPDEGTDHAEQEVESNAAGDEPRTPSPIR
jgi:hypothetical protein